MTDQTNQTGGSQAASGQSSSNSTGQSQQQQGQGAQSGASETQAQGQAQGSAPQRPDYILETEWDAGANSIKQDVFGQRVKDLAAFKAEQEIRKNALPQSPDKYEIALPKDFKAPEGMKFELDPSDPLFAVARERAHARGLDQEAFSDLIGVFAANKLAEQSRLDQARNAEMQKLGPAGNERVSHLETWLKNRVGTKADPLVNQLKAFPHAGMVDALESIVAQFSSQGGTQFDQRHRVNEQNEGKIPGYESMSFIQKRAAQTNLQQKTAGGGR